MPEKYLKCPVCGSALEDHSKSGYTCPNPNCNVVKVKFNRKHEITRITREGIEDLGSFGQKWTRS